MEIKKILFPTDFTEGALAALPYAADMATTFNAKLYLLHVIYDISTASGLQVPHISLERMYEEIEESAKKELESFGAEVREGLKNVETRVLRGVPYEEILKFARDEGIDLIIIGTHGRSGIERVILGSTAEKVVRNSACPVLTVRSRKKA